MDLCAEGLPGASLDLLLTLHIRFSPLFRRDDPLLTYLKDPKSREVLLAEVFIQGILSGRTVDMEEIEAGFTNISMIETIRRYLVKTTGAPETTA